MNDDIKKVIDDYLEYLKNNYSKSTYNNKKYHVKRFVKFLSLQKIDQFSVIAIDKLETFFNSINKKSMKKKFKYEVGNLFIYLVEKKIIACNPLGKLKRTIRLKTDKMKKVLNCYIKYVEENKHCKNIITYKTHVKQFLCFLEKQNIDDFNKIGMNNIDDFLFSIENTEYRQQHLKELQKLFIYLVKTHIIKKNPFGNLKVGIDFNKLPQDLQYYFIEYLKTKRSYRLNLGIVLKLFYQYFIENNLCSIENLTEIHIGEFFIFLQNLKNHNGNYYKKSTKKNYLLILKNWFIWLLEEKGFTNIEACLNQLDKIICKYNKEKGEIYIFCENDLKLVKKFMKYEKLRGYKRYNIKYLLKPFFKYIENNDLEFSSIRHREAQKYQSYLATLTDKEGNLSYCTRSISSILNVTCNFYKYLKKEKIAYSNPFLRIKRIKTEKYLPRNLPVEEDLKKILDTLKYFWKKNNLWEKKNYYKLHVIAEVMYSTGMRISEVSNLEADDIDFNRHVILIRESKTNKERIAYLNEYAENVLKIYIDNMRKTVNRNIKCHKLFGTKNLKDIVNKRLKKLSAKYPDFTSHAFRHCVGYHLLKNGCDLRYIQLILGHESLKSTALYTKIDKKDLRCELDNYHPRTFIKA